MTSSGNQKTIVEETSFSGKALQTGENTQVTCRPAHPDAGIIFIRTDIESKPSIRVGDMIFSDMNERRSSIGFGDAKIQTVEHFMSVLWALEIDNLIVEIDGAELPAMDGSAVEFLKILKEAGIKEQPASKNSIKISRPVTVEEGSSSLTVMPDEGFSVSYSIDYECGSIGKEEFSIELDGDSFEREIAPARTFCLRSEAEALLKAGLGGGATLENTLVMDENGPVGTHLRFPNEPVRHKILDLVGDLYLLGMPVTGKVVAKRSGHKLNLKMVKLIYEKYVASGNN